MWIERFDKKLKFINGLLNLSHQVMIVCGARQVGKTAFVLNVLQSLKETPHVLINLLYPQQITIEGREYLGRNCVDPTGVQLVENLRRYLSGKQVQGQPVYVFIDEVDHYPAIMEAVQYLAELTDEFKFVFTGSNLENIQVKNAATGRKKYFDLYPITFGEFLANLSNKTFFDYYRDITIDRQSDYFHKEIKKYFNIYVKIGGLPKIVDTYLENKEADIPTLIKDLALTIEENVKTILGEKAKIYEYEDVLRKLALLSMNTLKYSQLQVQHVSRGEAKRLVNKTVGARVVHKIRLYDDESRDLSKYLLFDCGMVNYLLNGSHLLTQQIPDKYLAIMYETFVGNELIALQTTRDDLYYWKSPNRAEVEFVLRAPFLVGFDVKVNRGDNKSLYSFAIMEPDAKRIVKIGEHHLSLNKNAVAKLPHDSSTRSIHLLNLPHYLTAQWERFN